MMEPKLSIIVPFYNVEEYLPRCIESILKQPFTDFELILVDDGSTDNSPKISDAYVAEDQRITVIHQANQGVSEARNRGMKIARGKYIAFVDGDDLLVSDAYTPLIREMDEHQLEVLNSCCRRMVNGEIKHVKRTALEIPDQIFSGIDFLYLHLKQRFFGTGPWLNMYRRKFLLDNDLFFKGGILHEDELWTPQVFLAAKRVKHIEHISYIYVLRSNSITTAKDRTQNGIDLLNICYELEPHYAEIDKHEHRKYLNDFLLEKYLFAVYMGKLYRPAYRHLIRKNFVQGKPLSMKNRIKAGLFRIDPQLYVKLAELRH